MNCPACRRDNTPDAAFCAGCGARLVHVCPMCQRTSPPDARFCSGCGRPVTGEGPAPRAYTPKHLAEKILASRAALEGERKQVTVLFADVKGSMDLAERVDAEAWHGIMDSFFHLLADGVHRFEGTVNQFTGDGIRCRAGSAAPGRWRKVSDRDAHLSARARTSSADGGDKDRVMKLHATSTRRSGMRGKLRRSRLSTA